MLSEIIYFGNCMFHFVAALNVFLIEIWKYLNFYLKIELKFLLDVDFFYVK